VGGEGKGNSGAYETKGPDPEVQLKNKEGKAGKKDKGTQYQEGF